MLGVYTISNVPLYRVKPTSVNALTKPLNVPPYIPLVTAKVLEIELAKVVVEGY